MRPHASDAGGLDDAGEAGAGVNGNAAVPSGMRHMLNIPAPVPQAQGNQVQSSIRKLVVLRFSPFDLDGNV